MDKRKELALTRHKEWGGKLEITARAPVSNADELAIAYTPGVAEPCLAIQQDVDLSYIYTRRHNLIAVVTDGSAVLGLGNIGPEAGMPVMEGKCALFKAYGGVDAFPLCIRSQDSDEIVRTVTLLAGSFGGINLEDISAPRCFEIERRLKQTLDIPVFHDDQHGTAVVTLAALRNALKVVDKSLDEVRILINGAGAAAMAIAKLLRAAGLDPAHLIMCDSKGAIYEGRSDLNAYKAEIAAISNPAKLQGKLDEVIDGMDVFIGVSAAGVLKADMVSKMSTHAIVFACANPVPEIMPEEALAAGAAVVATGRSDYPNQINNVLAFPGIFRGTLDCRASDISEGMNLAAARAIADLVSPAELDATHIMPNAFDPRVAPAVAREVIAAARSEKLNRI